MGQVSCRVLVRARAQPSLTHLEDEISALVLDPGWSVTRAGFAGEDTPKSVIPSHYARKSAASEPLFDDSVVYNPFAGVDVANPMADDGTVADWDVAAKLWEYAMTSRLTGRRQTPAIRNGLNDSKDEGGDTDMADAEQVEEYERAPMAENPLLVTEPDWNTTKNREKTMELAMEGWGVPAFWLGRSGVLSAFASGKPTSLVIDIGAASTAVSAMHDGLLLKKSVQHSSMAGNFVSEQTRLLFSQSQPPVPITPHYMVSGKSPVDAGAPAQATYRSFAQPPSAGFRRLQEERVLSEFKENVVQVWNPERNNGQSLANSMEFLRAQEASKPFEMPDGWNNVFGPERYRPAEGLFDDKAAITVCLCFYVWNNEKRLTRGKRTRRTLGRCRHRRRRYPASSRPVSPASTRTSSPPSSATSWYRAAPR